ncbi:MAG: hypothetical protein ABIS30_10775 [Gallionella sp.]
MSLVVSEDTRRMVKDFLYRELDHLRVKGKDKPLAIRDEVRLFHGMRRLYQQPNWDQAELQLCIYSACRPKLLYKNSTRSESHVPVKIHLLQIAMECSLIPAK